MYLLDTNTVIARLNGHQLVAGRLRRLSPESAILCAPVLAELEFGANASARKEENLERLRLLSSAMRFVSFGQHAAERFGQIKSSLRRRGIAKSDFDLAIASIALEIGATVVSEDRAFHDGSIAGLAAENWLGAS
ncbi:MAG TPA: PIN domain-containing protein [Thermoanaerobaculia bacterium]|nr:PIN domain-containing protein [Thermoanaerobaculia bacterium]